MSSRPLGVIVEFLAAFARVMRWRVGLACALIVLSGATEGLGLLLLFPLLAALGVHGGDSTPGRLAAAVLSWLQRGGHGPELATLIPDPSGPARLRDAWWCPLSPSLALVIGAPGANGDVALQVGARLEGSRVRVDDVTDSRVALCLVGRAASEVLTRAGARELAPGSVRSESIGGIPTLVLHSSERHWLLVAPAEDAADLWLALSEAGAPLGLAYVGMDALQHLVAARD